MDNPSITVGPYMRVLLFLYSMVLVVKDWPSFKEYIEKWGYLAELVYRVDPVHAEKGVRVRVLGGRYGLDMNESSRFSGPRIH